MTTKKVHEFLTAHNLIALIKGEWVLTNNYTRALYNEENRDEEPTLEDSILNKTETKVKPVVSILTRKEIFETFKKDAEVPWRVTTESGTTYTVSSISKEALNVLCKVIERVDYERLCQSTKAYYKSNIAKKGLTNYFLHGEWEGIYENYKNIKNLSEGTNKFED